MVDNFWRFFFENNFSKMKGPLLLTCNQDEAYLDPNSSYVYF